MAQVLEQAALASDKRFSSNVARVANSAALDAIIESCFAKRTREELVLRLSTARIAFAEVETYPWDPLCLPGGAGAGERCRGPGRPPCAAHG